MRARASTDSFSTAAVRLSVFWLFIRCSLACRAISSKARSSSSRAIAAATSEGTSLRSGMPEFTQSPRDWGSVGMGGVVAVRRVGREGGGRRVLGALAALLVLPALDGAAQDLADERAVVGLRAVGDQAEIAVVGRQAGERIHFDHEDASVGRQPEIDAGDVAASEGHERGAAGARGCAAVGPPESG